MTKTQQKTTGTAYMTQKDSRWYFHMRVPTRLLPIYGPRAILWESLDTTDRTKAGKARDALVTKYQAEFAQWKGVPDSVIAEAAAAGGREAWLRRHAQWQRLEYLITSGEGDAAQFEAAVAAGDIDAIRRILAFRKQDQTVILPEVRATIAQEAPIAAILSPTAAADSLALTAVCARMLRLDPEGTRSPEQAARITNACNDLVLFAGRDLELTDSKFRDTVDAFMNSPAVLTTKKSKASRKALANHLAQVTLWSYQRGDIARDPLAGLKGKHTDKRSAVAIRDPWSPVDVARAVAALPSLPQWGDPMTSDRSAALLLAIGTGCRIGEALQLRPGDVRECDATARCSSALPSSPRACGGAGWAVYFDGWHDMDPPKVRNDGAERTIKNSDSVRCVPLHPAIVPAILAAKARAELHSLPRLFGAIAAADVKPQGTDAKTQHAAKAAADKAVKTFTGSPMRALQRHLGVKHTAHGLRHSMRDLFGDRVRMGESMLGHAFDSRYGSKATAAELRTVVDSLPVLGVA